MAKVSLALSVIYWHITRLAQAVCVRVVGGAAEKKKKAGVNAAQSFAHVLMRFVSLRLLDGSIIVVFSFGSVEGAGGSNDSPVLYRCSLGFAIILCPSLPPLHLLLSSSCPPSLAPCSDNLITEP